jgi:uncharacterized protein (TIGR00725 family)
VTEPAARAPLVAVIGGGAGAAGEDVLAAAEAVGRGLAQAGAVLVTGGRGGVMEAACRGAASAGGVAVGLLPGDDVAEANRWVTIPLRTGLGEGRNVLVARAGDAVIAIGGEYGTLSELGFALKLGRPVIGLGTWGLVRPGGEADDRVFRASDPADAVARALELATAA